MTPEQLAALVADHKRIARHHAGTQMGGRSANTADAIEHLQAEVARLSTPPDDAEVRNLLDLIQAWVPGHSRAEAYEAFARIRYALAAEKAKREAMEAALHTISGHVVLNNENDEELSDSALTARATLAKHGSK